jgi:4-hydroxybenzoate polyprenyltransferase
MAIMPMIDAYTTGLDWLAEAVPAPPGLIWFLLVTFLNGMLIEIGRKIRAPQGERPGVDTYTQLWGTQRAPTIWVSMLALTAIVVLMASRHTGGGPATEAVLLAMLLLAGMPALAFRHVPAVGAARQIELASGLWPLATYLLLGGGPFLARWMSR